MLNKVKKKKSWSFEIVITKHPDFSLILKLFQKLQNIFKDLFKLENMVINQFKSVLKEESKNKIQKLSKKSKNR